MNKSENKYFPFTKLNDGFTPFTNSVTIFNVFLRHFNTSLRYCFANSVLEIFVADWWWDPRDLGAFSPWIPALSFPYLGVSLIRQSSFFCDTQVWFHLIKPYLMFRNLEANSLFTEYILLCKLTTSATKSGLLSSLSDFSLRAVITMWIIRWKLKTKVNSWNYKKQFLLTSQTKTRAHTSASDLISIFQVHN